MKRGFVSLVVLAGLAFGLISCGNSNPSTNQPVTSGLKFRAFVSNPLEPIASGGGRPAINIVDAMKDVLSRASISLTGVVPEPGLMAVSPSKKFTIVFSSTSNSLAVVDNVNERVAQNSAGQNVPAITMPGSTESMVAGIDDTTVFVAAPNAAVVGQSPGAVLVVNFLAGRIAATLPVQSAHWVVRSHNGNRLLAFGDNSNTVAVIAPSLIGTSTDPRTFVCCFDHPVWGLFSPDDSTAYILNCGPECGGTTAGVTVLDLNTNTAGTFVPLSAATIGFLSNNTLYVAGTPPLTACGSGTAATTCGTLNVVDIGTLTVTNSSPILISDGYHDRIDLGSNNLLFVGARNCTNITASSGSGEVRGCLSLFNTTTSNAIVAADNGDVTGIQPITFRNVVYVVENGELRIYDTATAKLQTTQVDILGQAIDVKLVD